MPPRPLRVTMVNKYYSPPHLGGVETVVRTLSEGLVEHAGAHVRALVSNEAPRRAEETIGGVHVVRLPRQVALSSAPVAVGMAGALRDEARRQGPQGPEPPGVINLHAPYPWGELSFLRAGLDIPSVVLYHSDIVRQKRLLAAYKPFLERFLDRVDLVMTSSPNIVHSSPFLAPRADKCRVVPFGLPPATLYAAPGVASRAATLRAFHPGRRIVLFAGRLVYYKGADVLVRAMRGVDADLVLIGRGPLESKLRTLAAEVGIAERIWFLPSQSGVELAAWYHAADVLCLPSVNEGVPNVVLEAFACGLPVVASRVGGIPEVHPGETCGRLVEPRLATVAAALRAVLREPPPTAPIAAHGAQFTWERTAAEYHALLLAAAGQ